MAGHRSTWQARVGAELVPLPGGLVEKGQQTLPAQPSPAQLSPVWLGMSGFACMAPCPTVGPQQLHSQELTPSSRHNGDPGKQAPGTEGP